MILISLTSPKSESSKKESPKPAPPATAAVSGKSPGTSGKSPGVSEKSPGNNGGTGSTGIFSGKSPGNNGGTGSSGTEKDQRSSGSGKTGNRRRRTQVPMTSSSSEDEFEKSKKNRISRLHHHYNRKNSRDLLSDFRSSTTPRNHGSSHKNRKSREQTRYKSSENILENVDKSVKNNNNSTGKQTFSEGELLEDKSIFDFTSNRAKSSGPFDHLLNKRTSTNPNALDVQAPKKSTVIDLDSSSKKSNNDSNSDKSHEPFGSTEFPTLKRNLKLSSTQWSSSKS